MWEGYDLGLSKYEDEKLFGDGCEWVLCTHLEIKDFLLEMLQWMFELIPTSCGLWVENWNILWKLENKYFGKGGSSEKEVNKNFLE